MSDEKPNGKTPTEYDRQVGERLRELRNTRGMSQQALAKTVGVSFQQVQKYENGRNRISASRLKDISAALKVSLREIYENLTPEAERVGGFAEAPPPRYAADDAPGTFESSDVVIDFNRIRNPTVRRHLAILIKALANAPPSAQRGRPRK